MLFKALVNIETPIPVLCVARRTHADVTPLRVHTLVLTVVRTHGTLVHISTGSSIAVQFVTWRASALEGAKSVMALVLAGRWSL